MKQTLLKDKCNPLEVQKGGSLLCLTLHRFSAHAKGQIIDACVPLLEKHDKYIVHKAHEKKDNEEKKSDLEEERV